MEASGGDDEHVNDNHEETTRSSRVASTTGSSTSVGGANGAKSTNFPIPTRPLNLNGAVATSSSPTPLSMGGNPPSTGPTSLLATAASLQGGARLPPAPVTTSSYVPTSYTPEMIRQAQLQMQYLQQQMRMAAATAASGTRPSGTPVSSNATSQPTGHVRPLARPPAAFARPPLPASTVASAAGTTVRSPLMSSSALSPTMTSTAGMAATPTSMPPHFQGTSLPIVSQLHTVPSFNPTMDERAFVESLSRFMTLCNCPLKRIPQMRPDHPMPMLRLFQLVTAFGGYQRVCESNRWTAIAVSMEVTPITPETVAHLQKIYATLLFAYEQVYFLKMPLDRVIWPHQMLAGIAASARSAVPGGVGSQPFLAGGMRPPSASKTTATPGTTLKPPQSMGMTPSASGTSMAVAPSLSSSAPFIKLPPTAAPGSGQSPALSGSTSSPISAPHVAPSILSSTSSSAPGTSPSSIVTLTKRMAPLREDQQQQQPPPAPSKAPPPEPTTETVFRTAHRLKTFARSTIAWPRISLEDLTLMLAAPNALLVSLSLLLLERVSATAVDQGPLPGDPSIIIDPLLNALCALFLRQMRSVDEFTSSAVRPFDWFLRREEARTTDLLQSSQPAAVAVDTTGGTTTGHYTSLLNPLVNVLRNLSLIPGDVKTGSGSVYGQLMSQHGHLLSRIIIPILIDRRWWPVLNLEIYTSAWLIFGQLLPHLTLTSISTTATAGASTGAGSVAAPTNVLPAPIRLSLLQVAIEEVRFCWEAQHRWAHIVHPTSEQVNEPGQLMEFITRLPSRTFSLTSTALRLLTGDEGLGINTAMGVCMGMSTGLAGADESSRGEDDGETEEGIRRMAYQLMEVLERAALLLFPLAFVYVQDAQRQLSMARAHPATYANTLGRHLHNPQAALPDGGHLELALGGLLMLLRRSDRPLDGLLVRTLIGWVDALRSLYVQFSCPLPGTVPYILPREGTWQSILLVSGSSGLTANYSHPYRLLVLVQDILLSLPPLGPSELGEAEVSTIIDWIAGPAPGPVHADLLRPAVMERLVNSLLT